MRRGGVGKFPKNVLEIGPGDSLCLAFCFLLCGSETYTSVDNVNQISSIHNLEHLNGVYKFLTVCFDEENNKTLVNLLVDAFHIDSSILIINYQRLCREINSNQLDQSVYRLPYENFYFSRSYDKYSSDLNKFDY